jgi:quinol monooxygenase YgiN
LPPIKSSIGMLWIVLTCLLCMGSILSAQGEKVPLVRIAEIEIKPEHLEAYKSALREEIEASIRLEPGVLTLYAVALKDSPSHIRIFETYADRKAYESHLNTSHFLKYKTTTGHMIKSLKLVETDPVYLGAKSK